MLVVLFSALVMFSSNVTADCVNSDGVVLRADKGLKSPVTWRVRKFLPLIPVGGGSYNGWIKVRDMDGDIHWVKQKYITKEYHCVAVKIDGVPIKKNPFINSPNKYNEPAKKYDTFKFLGVSKGWINVEDAYGDTGWIQYENVFTD